MNCVETDNLFLHSRLDKNDSADELHRLRNNNQGFSTSSSSSSSEPITPHQESLHSFRFSSPNTTSSGLALALSKDSQQSDNLNYITQITSSLELIDMPNTQPTTTTTHGSLTPVTPDDREPINNSGSNIKRSASFSCLKSGRRHRTSLVSNTLYPSTSTNTRTTTTTTTNTATSLADQNISRYLPQNQAVITTQDNWRISLSNHIATMILSGSKRNNTQDFIGKHILDFIDVSHRPLLLEKIVKRRDDYQHVNINGSVLICGDVIPIIKQDGTKSSASLWLKEKKSDNGSSIFIWILEEVFQSTLKIRLDDKSSIESIDNEDANELLGYSSTELSQKPIQQLVPQYNATDKFFGCRTKLNAYFPVMIGHTDQHTIRITSMPALAGLVTVACKSGLIQTCNTAFSKYLFGYRDLSNVPLSKLIPHYTTLISCLERDELLLDGYILNNAMCCDILGANLPQQQPPVRISAVHRDGTCFDIDLQIKLLDGQNAYALWITFDRETVFQRQGHKTSIHKLQQEQFEKETANLAVTTANSSFIRSKSVNLPTNSQKTLLDSPTTATNTKNVLGENASQEKPPLSKITSFSRPAFTSALSKNATTSCVGSNPPPAAAAASKSIWPRIGEYSAQTLKTSIQDYEIVDELGQGAYGLVKLAYLKSDPEKKRVVIKYVIKSRILVDCWTRDRKLGLIPAEIHVLHTLRKIPHINCSDMLDYFEDDDNYYVVMDLYGAGMDLFDYIEFKESGLTESEIRSIFRQVVAAVGHLHDHRIVHRDIKDENVILDLKGGVRLIDFGSAAYMKEGRQYETFVGTLDYAAPEILKGQTYTGPPQDIWACGTLLYTLIYRENPFYNIDEIMERELRIPFVLSQESVDLIRHMLERDVQKRLTIHQVLEHPWFKMN